MISISAQTAKSECGELEWLNAVVLPLFLPEIELIQHIICPTFQSNMFHVILIIFLFFSFFLSFFLFSLSLSLCMSVCLSPPLYLSG